MGYDPMDATLLRHLSLLVEGGVVALGGKRQYCVARIYNHQL